MIYYRTNCVFGTPKGRTVRVVIHSKVSTQVEYNRKFDRICRAAFHETVRRLGWDAKTTRLDESTSKRIGWVRFQLGHLKLWLQSRLGLVSKHHSSYLKVQ